MSAPSRHSALRDRCRTIAGTTKFGEAGSRSQRARATQPSAWSAPDGLLIVMDASQPLAGPTQAGGGHFIAQRHRRFLPA